MGDVRDSSALRHGTVGSSARSQFPRIPIKLENSYRLEPTNEVSRVAMMKIIKETFHSMLENKPYDETECRKLVKLLSDMIKEQVKSLGYQRYKIIATVALGPFSSSTLLSASRFLWNDQQDTYAAYTFSNTHLYATGTVYAVYLD